MYIHRGLALFVFLLVASVGFAANPSELCSPTHINVDGKPLDIERTGHAAPFVGDFDENGNLCLLVGQFSQGRLRIYRNTGSRSKPQFDTYTWFRAGGKIASVPVG